MPMAVKCAVVSRRACRKRRRRNSPCMREDVTMVLVMAGMKVLMMFAAVHWRATGMKRATGNAAAHSMGAVHT